MPHTPRYKRFCFTLNNYSDAEYNRICDLDHVRYLIVGKEISTGGTRHLQGYVHTLARNTFKAMKKRISPRCHIEMAKGSELQNIEYCKKEGDYITKGETVQEENSKKINATIREIVKSTERNPEEFILKRDDSDTINAYKCNVRAIEKLWSENKQQQTIETIREKYKNSSWRQWQQALLDELIAEPDPRKIIWYNDPVGNSGKTYLSRYLQTLDGIRFENGRSLDLKFMYNGQRTVIFDLTRSQEQHINYEVMESIKNGLICSCKYVSVTKSFDIPHVIVFANYEPDQSKMSADRWDIRTITPEDNNMIFKEILQEFLEKEIDSENMPPLEEIEDLMSSSADTDKLIDEMFENRSECEYIAEKYKKRKIMENTPLTRHDAIDGNLSFFCNNEVNKCNCQFTRRENEMLREKVKYLNEQLDKYESVDSE